MKMMPYKIFIYNDPIVGLKPGNLRLARSDFTSRPFVITMLEIGHNLSTRLLH